MLSWKLFEKMLSLSNNTTNGKFHQNNIVTLNSFDEITNLQKYIHSGKIKPDSSH